MNRRIAIIALLVLFDTLCLSAQNFRYLAGGYSRTHLRTNLVHDLLLVPNVGVEYELSDRWSVVADASCAWWSMESRNRFWRIMTGEVELRRWLGWRLFPPYADGGHHLGVYAAVYRYDLAWGGSGQQADLNYGGGVSYGYALSLSRRLSLDLSVGVGYLGGRYKKYKPDGGQYVRTDSGTRHYFGPTKLEAALVWHL